MLSKIALEQFILTWPGDEPVEVQWAGERVLVPGRTGRADAGIKGSLYRYGGARGSDGELIPGTVVLRDIIENDPETSGPVKRFDARNFVVGVETSCKALLARGFEIVSDVSEVADALARNREKYEESKEIAARQTIAEELERRTYWEKKGVPAPTSSSSKAVTEALAFMEARKTQQSKAMHKKEDLLAALGIAPEAAAAPAPKPVAAPVEDEAALVSEALVNGCEEAGIPLTKPELLGLLKRDTNVMKAVSAKLERATAAA